MGQEEQAQAQTAVGAVDPLERYHRVVKITRSTEAKSELKLTVPHQVEVSRQTPPGVPRTQWGQWRLFFCQESFSVALPRTLSPRPRLREHVEIVKYR